jgi:hypothetical protein
MRLWVQVTRAIDDGELSTNLVIRIPRPGEERDNMLVIYNIKDAIPK